MPDNLDKQTIDWHSGFYAAACFVLDDEPYELLKAYKQINMIEQIKLINLSYKHFTEINNFVALDIETTGLSPIYNVRFDISFINHAIECNGLDKFITRFVDTLAIARRFRKNNSLENLVRDYVNSDYEEMHQGLDDALNTAKVFYVFKRMVERKKI